MSLSAGCAMAPPTPDPCAWVKGIGAVDPIVIGGSTWTMLVEENLLSDEVLNGRHDVLTPKTAGRIAAHDQAAKEFCGAD